MFTLSVNTFQPGWFVAKFYSLGGHDATQRQVLDGFLQCGNSSKISPSQNASTQVTSSSPPIPEYPSSSSSLSVAIQRNFGNVEKIRSREVVDSNLHERVGVCIVRSHSASQELCRTYAKSQQTATFLVYTRNHWYLCRQRPGCSPKMICEITRMMFNSGTQVREDEITSLKDAEIQTVGNFEEVMMDYKRSKIKRMQNRACGDDSSCTTVVTVEDVVEDDMEACEVTVEIMSTVLKEGSLEKWSDGKKSFHSAYAKLLSNGYFQWFDSMNSSSPKRSIDIRAVSSFLAFGPVLHQVPCKPSAFSESDIERSFGVPHEAHQGTAVTFFRCSSQAEMASWMDSVNRLLFGNMGANSGIVPQQTVPVQSGPYQSYGPPSGFYSPQSAVAPPPLPPGVANYPGPTQFPPYTQPPMAPPMGAPYSAPQPMQPPLGAPYGAYPNSNQPAAGPSYNYYPTPQQPMPSQQQQQQQQVFYDKNGKPYTIVYKDGKPKKKKWKKAALGLAAGAATGYVAGKMFGGLGRALGYGLGGWGGGWGRPYCGGGFGRWGSWSSLSSFSSSGGWSS